MVEAKYMGNPMSLLRMVQEKCLDPSATSILELGYEKGSFADILIMAGYNAEGVGFARGKKDTVGRAKFHYGDLTDLEATFGERKFNSIVARGVFCEGSQLYHILETREDLPSPKELRKAPAETIRMVLRLSQENIRQILSSSFGQLESGGYLLICEDYKPTDSVDFTQDVAEDIGYIVEKLERQEAILQKPIKTNNL